ncbi:hypothetical protein SAY86_000825 [Trapa natans]|uniref:BZIP domain-containing protein n=1 Tax=Trapa natans TaxID=22666 RepID=A0AAN7RFZ0_TRANT|nr:hypothetical protein SAY86_000825 [Trapa natans]
MADFSRPGSSTNDPDDKNRRIERIVHGAAGTSSSSDTPKEKSSDQKSLRRLAQNREAARKSRLRKKVCLFFLGHFVVAEYSSNTFSLDFLNSVHASSYDTYLHACTPLVMHVQQLERSRMKLTQLEQELQGTRQKGKFTLGSRDQSHSTSGTILIFLLMFIRITVCLWRVERDSQVYSNCWVRF